MIPDRICVACRQLRRQADLIRLTCDYRSKQVTVTSLANGVLDRRVTGRSAYICPNESCVEQALKGTRLKFALEGRRKKGAVEHRSVSWPLEAQLIQLIITKCTEARKTCQNTQEKGGSE